MPDDRKVAVVRDWPIPKDGGEVRPSLGMASYYRRYFVDLAAPFHILTQKDTLFTWSSECDAAFNMLKEKLT